MLQTAFFTVSWGEFIPELLNGLLTTLKYTVVGFVGAVILGMLAALMRRSRIAPLRIIAAIYTEFFKNIPLLVIVFVIYFGLATSGLKLDAFTSGTIALVLFYGAYLSEIFRAAMNGVDRGQTEGAQALGMKGSAIFFHIIAPQAVRLALPGMNAYLVDLLKGTSILVTIAAGELMAKGQVIAAKTFAPLEVYIVIALIYFVLCYPVSQLLLWIERKVHRGDPLFPGRKRRLSKIRRELADTYNVTTAVMRRVP
ncbi:amino acid ABC transporter permease [Leucobacter sp. CSA2]|uniref:Amino acid ABC transporter permease n=1 Tax=Leucobacter edaphi TaxID=2796472 RepID=A0A934QDP8_9MICO|nr:amino acid ABC transporter permease [Leucobacter edaphi]MBK0421921.1 amino acid ABC transporter permease [Leucobacter edaphi]